MMIHKDDSLTDKNVVDSARLLLAQKARELLRKENSWIAYLPVAKKRGGKKKETGSSEDLFILVIRCTL